MNESITLVLTKDELQAVLILFDIAVKSAGLTPASENALILARKFSAAAAPPANTDAEQEKNIS